MFIWILCLSMLSVGAKNFETGLSIDGPLYAAISRQIARSGEWFYLDGGIPDFLPFTEHTHLGFWIQALLFKILPIADWSARVSGHIFYLAFLMLFFVTLKKLHRERVAVLGVLLLWSWPAFSNYFSNFYLDPGALFFGSLFLVLLSWGMEKRRQLIIVVSGLSLGLCFMQKGLTALGFGPLAALICIRFFKTSLDRRKQFLWLPTLCLLSCGLLLAVYMWSISKSSVPDFLRLYWERQMALRFAQNWNWSNVIAFDFWHGLSRNSFYFLYFLPAIFLDKKNLRNMWIPATLLFSFVLMYAPAGRQGAQYSLMMLPWVAWCLAVLLDNSLPSKIDSKKLTRISKIFAVSAILALQYIPLRVHSREAPETASKVAQFFLNKPQSDKVLWAPHIRDFTLAASLSWFADVRVVYQKPTKSPELALFSHTDPDKTEGWCRLDKKFELYTRDCL